MYTLATIDCSLEIISITIKNSRWLNTDPWCNPTFTLNALLSPPVVLTTVCAPSYIAMTAFTNHSSTPVFLRAHLVTSLGTLSNAFFQIYIVELLSFTRIFLLHLSHCEDCISSSLAYWRRRADVKGVTPLPCLGVLERKEEVQRVILAGWRQEGHSASKTLLQFLFFQHGWQQKWAGYSHFTL